jgi:5'-nucleotidase
MSHVWSRTMTRMMRLSAQLRIRALALIAASLVAVCIPSAASAAGPAFGPRKPITSSIETPPLTIPYLTRVAAEAPCRAHPPQRARHYRIAPACSGETMMADSRHSAMAPPMDDMTGAATASPASATTSGTAAAATSYTVVKGDSLWSIAKAHYGDGRRYTVIHAANSASIANPNLIHPGQVLTLPAATASMS